MIFIQGFLLREPKGRPLHFLGVLVEVGGKWAVGENGTLEWLIISGGWFICSEGRGEKRGGKVLCEPTKCGCGGDS